MKNIFGVILTIWIICLGPGKASAQFFSSRIEFGNPFPAEFQTLSQEGDRLALEVSSSDSPGSSPGDGSPPPDFESRFSKGKYQFGLTVGSGASFDLLSVDSPGDIRTELRFLYLFGNFKYNLTGITGKSFYRGALYWVLEAGTAVTWKDPKNVFGEVAEAPTYVVGFVPVQFEYKFIQPDSKWAPVFFGGVGVTWGEWHKTTRELATAFEFILQSGAGIEYFLDNGSSVSLNYRLWHLSNSNIKSPNIGINAHVFSISVSF